MSPLPHSATRHPYLFARRAARGAAAALAIVCAFVAAAQDGAATSGTPVAPEGEDEVIVTGRIGELRQRIEAAEVAVYSRFNDINSDDRFDIHCRLEMRTGTHIPERRCLSNSWREQDVNYAEATLRELRGESGPTPQSFHAEQQAMQGRLANEMQRLVTTDEQLKQALAELVAAKNAYTQEIEKQPTMFREVPPGPDGLPFGARRVFEVQIGKEPWRHALTEHTFTVALLSGEIREIDLECDGGHERRAYEDGVEWNVPASWSRCALNVKGKRETTFVLYEFE
jgi:hypothetical protein